jgi:hypothetical protein
MKLRSYLLAFVASLPLGVIIAILSAGEAGAADTRRYASNKTVYADGRVRELAAISVTAVQGDKYYINARMQNEDATARMLAELRLRCTSSSVDLYTTENMSSGQDLLVLRGRYIFRAPANDTYACRLQVRSQIPGGHNDPNAKFLVRGSGTFIAVSVRQPPWVKHRYQDTAKLIRTNRAKDVAAMSFAAPSDITDFSATADVEMTNCYNDGRLCDTSPRNSKSAVVGSRLMVMQRAVGGGFCRTTRWPSSGLDRTTITRDEHHEKNYHRVSGVRVSSDPSCTRDFRIKVYTKVLSGNDVMIEAKPYSNVFVR